MAPQVAPNPPQPVPPHPGANPASNPGSLIPRLKASESIPKYLSPSHNSLQSEVEIEIDDPQSPGSTYLFTLKIKNGDAVAHLPSSVINNLANRFKQMILTACTQEGCNLSDVTEFSHKSSKSYTIKTTNNAAGTTVDQSDKDPKVQAKYKTVCGDFTELLSKNIRNPNIEFRIEDKGKEVKPKPDKQQQEKAQLKKEASVLGKLPAAFRKTTGELSHEEMTSYFKYLLKKLDKEAVLKFKTKSELERNFFKPKDLRDDGYTFVAVKNGDEYKLVVIDNEKYKAYLKAKGALGYVKRTFRSLPQEPSGIYLLSTQDEDTLKDFQLPDKLPHLLVPNIVTTDHELSSTAILAHIGGILLKGYEATRDDDSIQETNWQALTTKPQSAQAIADEIKGLSASPITITPKSPSELRIKQLIDFKKADDLKGFYTSLPENADGVRIDLATLGQLALDNKMLPAIVGEKRNKEAGEALIAAIQNTADESNFEDLRKCLIAYFRQKGEQEPTSQSTLTGLNSLKALGDGSSKLVLSTDGVLEKRTIPSKKDALLKASECILLVNLAYEAAKRDIETKRTSTVDLEKGRRLALAAAMFYGGYNDLTKGAFIEEFKLYRESINADKKETEEIIGLFNGSTPEKEKSNWSYQFYMSAINVLEGKEELPLNITQTAREPFRQKLLNVHSFFQNAQIIDLINTSCITTDDPQDIVRLCEEILVVASRTSSATLPLIERLGNELALSDENQDLVQKALLSTTVSSRIEKAIDENHEDKKAQRGAALRSLKKVEGSLLLDFIRKQLEDDSILKQVTDSSTGTVTSFLNISDLFYQLVQEHLVFGSQEEFYVALLGILEKGEGGRRNKNTRGEDPTCKGRMELQNSGGHCFNKKQLIAGFMTLLENPNNYPSGAVRQKEALKKTVVCQFSEIQYSEKEIESLHLNQTSEALINSLIEELGPINDFEALDKIITDLARRRLKQKGPTIPINPDQLNAEKELFFKEIEPLITDISIGLQLRTSYGNRINQKFTKNNALWKDKIKKSLKDGLTKYISRTYAPQGIGLLRNFIIALNEAAAAAIA